MIRVYEWSANPFVHFTQREIERLATDFRHRRANLRDDELVTGAELATRAFGADCVRFVESGMAWLDGLTLVIPADHPDLNFITIHESFHRVCIESAITFATSEESERAANAFAAAVLAPRKTVLHAYSMLGEKLRPLAKVFGLSQTSTVLRLAEVQRRPRAVVTKSGNVLAHSDRVRCLLADGAPGLKKTRLRGGIDEGRVAVRRG